MSARFPIAIVAAITAPWCLGQHVIPEPQEDPVQAAIQEFNRRDSSKPNEVTVVLPPETAASAITGPDPGNSLEAPVLVTGKAPPEGAELIEEIAALSPEADGLGEPVPKPRQGLSVHVEKLQTGTGNIDPSRVKLLAPFPAKPLSQPPPGWHLETSEDAPPFTREVELAPGKSITLTVRPHLLVPNADGTSVFSVPEPGFDPPLGYQQDNTVGAVLSQSVRELDDHSKQLGAVIDNLQQLLVSLPKPEPEPAPAPSPAPTPARKR